jgi:predicted MFS family arabinose efflux permease
VFFVNLPVGLVLIGLAAWLMPSHAARPSARLDLAGAGVLLVALLCLIGPLLLGADLGWASWLFAAMAAGAALLVAFWRLERHVERRHGLPLVQLDLLCDRGFATGLAAVFFFTFANISFYLTMTLYMQLVRHFSPLQSGTAVLPLAIGFALVSRIAGPRAQRRGIAALLQGCAVQIAGLAILGAGIRLGLGTPLALSALLVPFGIGQAMVMAPLYGLVLAKVPTAHAGSGGGVVTTVQQVGNGAGVAVIGALYYGLQAAHSGRFALLACLAILAVSIALTAGCLRAPHLRP